MKNKSDEDGWELKGKYDLDLRNEEQQEALYSLNLLQYSILLPCYKSEGRCFDPS